MKSKSVRRPTEDQALAEVAMCARSLGVSEYAMVNAMRRASVSGQRVTRENVRRWIELSGCRDVKEQDWL